MSIRTGTRLEQLQQLRKRIDLEIEYEQRTNPATPKRRPQTPRAEANTTARLRELGATTTQVRAWATTQGLTTSTRGRLSLDLINAYATAHTTEEGAHHQ